MRDMKKILFLLFPPFLLNAKSFVSTNNTEIKAALTISALRSNQAIELTSEAIFSELIKKDKVIIEFYKPGCGACNLFTPRFEKVASKYSDIIFVKVNTSKFPSLAKAYQVRGVPAVRLFQKDVVVAGFAGAQSESVLEKYINDSFK